MGAIRGGSFPLSACPDSDGGGATGRPLGPSWGPAGAAGSEAAFPAGAEKRRRWGDPQLRNAAHAEGLSLQQPEEGRGAGGLQPGRLAKEPLSVRPSPSRVALSSVGARGPLWLLEARARFPLLQETLDARVAATDRCLQPSAETYLLAKYLMELLWTTRWCITILRRLQLRRSAS
ncbi:uncharacterized protein LOC117660964 isoform X2 [Pantherophis guttatus]|uniref:Uncharacterized protein LOC117660964 isoform X2 n=1 Tax=Pantherophis guttatus TaxID=94885 RepID=A0ABM3ZAV8_PANGU|nr:uncharacterized protein LOC117660964 isoform X2 [Pantherophis guttatus]